MRNEPISAAPFVAGRCPHLPGDLALVDIRRAHIFLKIGNKPIFLCHQKKFQKSETNPFTYMLPLSGIGVWHGFMIRTLKWQDRRDPALLKT
jgi:hypothetical protein